MEMRTLNVGCGSDPWGAVRVDVAFSFITHHFRPTVLADASHLPFKDGVFEVVKASHLLEHLRNPFKALRNTPSYPKRDSFEISHGVGCFTDIYFEYFSTFVFPTSLGVSNKKEETTSMGC
jgi:hypothetical protein